MKRILLISLISTSTFATELKFTYPTYKLEYNPITQKIKVLSKSNSTKICDKEVHGEKTKALIIRNLKDKNVKSVVIFRCFRE